MDLKVKFFNSKNIREVESRRFKIDSFSLDFDSFLSHLKILFQINELEPVYVKWIDKNQWLLSENDWKDFNASYIETPDSVIKLDLFYGHIHINVDCDICENTVAGDRYKCLQCDNFDICELCFQSNNDIHKEHCLILLRTPEDSFKFLRSIPCQMSNGSDFRVLDIDLDKFFVSNENTKANISTQTNTINIDDKPTEYNEEESVDPKSKLEEKQEPTKSDQTYDETVSEQLYKSLPKEVKESLEKLESMGFTNIDSTLIALLVANNGNIFNVLEELDYSQKH